MTTVNPDQYTPLFNVVLLEPEIPQNTGNIGRLCVATRSCLNLVGRLGFELNEKARRRAGLDYWDRLLWEQYDGLPEYMQGADPQRCFFFTKSARKPLYSIDFKPGDSLVFGSETSGFPEHVRSGYADQMYAIPMLGEVRSLNLANSVAICVYEALRKSGNV